MNCGLSYKKTYNWVDFSAIMKNKSSWEQLQTDEQVVKLMLASDDVSTLLILTNKGRALGCGNTYGMLCQNSNYDSNTMVLLNKGALAGKFVTDADLSYGRTALITSDNKLYGCGSSSFNFFSSSVSSSQYSPYEITFPLLSNVTLQKVVLGYYTQFVVGREQSSGLNKVYGWGDKDYLGIGKSSTYSNIDMVSIADVPGSPLKGLNISEVRAPFTTLFFLTTPETDSMLYVAGSIGSDTGFAKSSLAWPARLLKERGDATEDTQFCHMEATTSAVFAVECTTGNIFSRGDNSLGLTGLGSWLTTEYTLEFSAENLPAEYRQQGISTIQPGILQTYIVTADRKNLLVCGSNSEGTLGAFGGKNVTHAPRPMPSNITIFGGDKIKQIVSGTLWFTVLLTEGGKMYSIGRNQQYSLGLGVLMTTTMEWFYDWQPVATGDLANEQVDFIQAGDYATVGITRSGRLFGFGSNTNRALCLGPYADVTQRAPKWSFDLSTLYQQKVKKVSLSYRHTLVLTAGGVVVGCGYNADGQLTGQISTDGNYVEYPTRLPDSINNFVNIDVYAGDDFSMVLNEQGIFYTMGANTYGSIGDFTQGTDRKYPSMIPFQTIGRVSPVSLMRSAPYSPLVITQNQKMFMWGRVAEGLIVDGRPSQPAVSAAFYNSPIQILKHARMNNTAAINAMMSINTLVLKVKEAYVCFGLDAFNDAVCSGNGQCIVDGVCHCAQGWGGPLCDQRTCFGVSYADSSVCSGHGICEKGGICNCEPGYYANVTGTAAYPTRLCVPCPAGTSSSTRNVTQCNPCPIGSFTNMTGSLQCSKCENCDAVASRTAVTTLATPLAAVADPFFSKTGTPEVWPLILQIIIAVLAILSVLIFSLGTTIVWCVAMRGSKTWLFQKMASIFRWFDIFGLKHYTPNGSSPVKLSTALGGIAAVAYYLLAVAVILFLGFDIPNQTQYATTVLPDQAVALNYNTTVVGNITISLLLHGYIADCKLSTESTSVQGLSFKSLHWSTIMFGNGTCAVYMQCVDCQFFGADQNVMVSLQEQFSMAQSLEYWVNLPYFNTDDPSLLNGRYALYERISAPQSAVVFKGPEPSIVSISVSKTIYVPLEPDYFFYGIFSKIGNYKATVGRGLTATRFPSTVGSTASADTFNQQHGVSLQFKFVADPNVFLIRQQSKQQLLDFLSKCAALIAVVSTVIVGIMTFIEAHIRARVNKFWQKYAEEEEAEGKEQELQDGTSPTTPATAETTATEPGVALGLKDASSKVRDAAAERAAVAQSQRFSIAVHQRSANEEIAQLRDEIDTLKQVMFEHMPVRVINGRTSSRRKSSSVVKSGANNV